MQNKVKEADETFRLEVKKSNEEYGKEKVRKVSLSFLMFFFKDLLEFEIKKLKSDSS